MLSVTIVHGCQLLTTIVTKSFILYVAEVWDPPSYDNTFCNSVQALTFYKFWITCKKLLSIRRKWQLKKKTKSELFLVSIFENLSFSSYENNIATTAFPSQVLIIFAYFERINSILWVLAALREPYSLRCSDNLRVKTMGKMREWSRLSKATSL